MATLTYDPAEPQEGEFTPEEQESLQVGEALEQQQQQLLAGKFKDAEDLEKGYLELQQKLGDSSQQEPTQEVENTEQEEPEQKEESSKPEFLDTLWDEAVNDAWTEDTVKALNDMDPKDVAKMHLEYRASQQAEPMDDKTVGQLKEVAGGEAEYSTMIGWAKDNLQEQEIAMYDQVMDKGDPLACYFAVQALKYRFDDASGTEGRMITGKAPSNRGNAFRSQAEVVRAMSDPKYENDPAYRQDVFNKLERSNIQF